MISGISQPVAIAARRIYEERFRETLEQSHRDQFVAIEPISGDYFLGQTLSEAIGRLGRNIRTGWLTHCVSVARCCSQSVKKHQWSSLPPASDGGGGWSGRGC